MIQQKIISFNFLHYTRKLKEALNFVNLIHYLITADNTAFPRVETRDYLWWKHLHIFTGNNVHISKFAYALLVLALHRAFL